VSTSHITQNDSALEATLLQAVYLQPSDHSSKTDNDETDNVLISVNCAVFITFSLHNHRMHNNVKVTESLKENSIIFFCSPTCVLRVFTEAAAVLKTEVPQELRLVQPQPDCNQTVNS
jgi:hypothetical protein